MRKLEKQQQKRALVKAKEAKRRRLEELARDLISEGDLLQNDMEVNIMYEHDV